MWYSVLRSTQHAEYTAAGVIDFNSGTTTVSAMSTDKDAVKSAIQSSQNPSGGTHISAGLNQGLSVMDNGSRSGARRVRTRISASLPRTVA